MDLEIIKNKIVNINFSKRKGTNKDVSNWYKSNKKKAFLTLHKSFLNQNNEVVLKLKAPPHIMDDINKGKVSLDMNEIFIPEEISEEINEILDQQLRVRFKDADLNDLTLANFL